MKDKLEPCPWCPNPPTEDMRYDLVSCIKHTRMMSPEEWNRRPSPSQSRVEWLEEVAKAARNAHDEWCNANDDQLPRRARKCECEIQAIIKREPQEPAKKCEGIKKGLRCSACVAAGKPCEPAKSGEVGD